MGAGGLSKRRVRAASSRFFGCTAAELVEELTRFAPEEFGADWFRVWFFEVLLRLDGLGFDFEAWATERMMAEALSRCRTEG